MALTDFFPTPDPCGPCGPFLAFAGSFHVRYDDGSERVRRSGTGPARLASFHPIPCEFDDPDTP